MDATPVAGDTITADWCAHAFDHLSPELGSNLHTTMDYMRAHHPVARSEQYGGFWILSKYEDVLKVAQDWETFSSAHGVTVPSGPTSMPAIPEMIDPPLHREYKRLINFYFRPPEVLQQEEATRELVTTLIDGFIESGSCDFMTDFARPLPGMVFFTEFLHAPAEELEEINRLSTIASIPISKEAFEARGEMIKWIGEFVEKRRTQPPLGDVVDAVMNAEIEGRPITQIEVVGILQLLLFGGLDTTAGALGMMMVRFCLQPEIPKLLREHPERISEAVEELLRLDGSFVCIARTAMKDVEIGGHAIKEGDKVLLSWASANRDEDEFSCPADFDDERKSNRHIAFGAGPHRCAGSNLARMNLRVAIEELVRRLDDIRLQPGAAKISFHSGFSRTPASVPLAFTPGPREGASAGAAG